ncbi:Actin-like protein arp9 (SWI/SNF complex component arp9) [Kappamyces sp. JEL0680]|nr:Actin-like protein arp9 (SWI/SNF complex component arp9) [Kappamyces sp. JEL0680]
MSFRDSFVLTCGSYKSQLGHADYLKLAKVHAYSKFNGKAVIKNGQVVDWEALEALWLTMILKAEMKLERMDPITLMVPNTWSSTDLELATQLLFEKLNVAALYLLEEPLGALYGVGNLTGLVVDIGHDTTDITPIYDNTPIQVGCRA